MSIKCFVSNPVQTASFSNIQGVRKGLLSFSLNYMSMDRLTLDNVIPKKTFEDSLSSKDIFSFIVLLDLLSIVWCFILSSESDLASYLQEDIFFVLIFVGIGAIYVLLKDIVLVALYVYDICNGKLTANAQDEYNYRSICAISLGWSAFEVLHSMMSEPLWLFGVSHVFFALCGLLVCIRILIALYVECFYKKPMVYDELNECYYDREQ